MYGVSTRTISCCPSGDDVGSPAVGSNVGSLGEVGGPVGGD